MSDLLVVISLGAAIGCTLRAAGWYRSKAANDVQAAASLWIAALGTMAVSYALARILGLF